MAQIIVDIETIPQALSVLESKMPEDIIRPVMPEELRDPEPPDMSKCPAYSLPELKKKQEESAAKMAECEPDSSAYQKHAEATKKATGKVEEAEAKQDKWRKETREAWEFRNRMNREKWELGRAEARAKFIQGAALDARLGICKLLGLRDREQNVTRIFVFEPDKDLIAKIRAWYNSLPLFAEGAKARKFRESALVLVEFREEKAMLLEFFRMFREAMNGTAEDEEGHLPSHLEYPECVTYYGNYFDFPFMYRRAWILGLPQRPLFQRGRYWTERMVDLHDYWQLGDRGEVSGGLDAMADALGAAGGKTRDGASFYKWYAEDPVEGVVYLINDLDATEFAGQRVGAIRDE